MWSVTSWRDSDWAKLVDDIGGSRERRPLRRRWMKWEDSMRRFVAEEELNSWMALAADKIMWNEKTDSFAIWYAGHEK